MSDQRFLPPEGEAPGTPREAGGPAPAAHHLAEDLRHEIEEIVEHVPRPVRWTVRKLALIVGLALLAAVVLGVVTLALYVANRTQWAAQELALIVNRTLAARSDLRLELRDIKGNVATGVRLIEPRLVFRQGGGVPVLEAHEIRLAYSPLTLLRARKGPIQVTIERPEVRIERGPDGRLRLPRWETGGRAGRPGAGDWQLRVRDGTAWIGGETWSFAGVQAELSARVGRRTRVDLRALRWARGPFHSSLRNLAGSVELGDSLRLEVRELASPDLRLGGRAAFARDAAGAGEFSVEFSDLRLRWLAEVLKNRSLDVPGTASGSASGRRDHGWSARFAASAQWGDLPLRAQGGLRVSGGRLALAPLSGASAAGELDGELDWSRDGWALRGRVRRADPQRWGFLGLRGWPAGRLDGRMVYQVDSRRRPADSRLAAWLGPSELAGWRVDTARVEVLMPGSAADTFTVRAFRRGGEFELSGHTLEGGWDGTFRAAGLALEEWPDGRALGLGGLLGRGEGRLHGAAGRLTVDAVLEGGSLRWAGTRASAWRLGELRGQLLPVSDLTGVGRAADGVFNGVHLDSLQGPFRLAGDSLALGECRAAAGDTLIRGDGRVAWGGGAWTFRTQHLIASSQQFHWVNDGEIALRGGDEGVTFERFMLRDGEARARFEGRWASAAGRHDWRGEVSGLELSRAGLPTALAAAGTVDAELRVWGPGEAPHWRLEGRGRGVGFQGRQADSVSLRVSGGPGSAEMEEGLFWLGAGRLALRGRVGETAEVWPAAIEPDAVRRWLAGGGRWEGSLRADAFPLERLSAWQPRARGLRGSVSGELTWTGRPSMPVFRLRLQAHEPGWENLALDRIEVEADYQSERLEVRRCALRRGATVSTVEGSLPLRLDLARGRAAIPDEGLHLRVELPGGDLAVLPLFVPQVGFAAGTFSLGARVEGTARHPDVSGSGWVRGGKLRLATREEVLQDLDAGFTLDESRITLDTLLARQGDRGRVAGHGYVDLDGLRPAAYRLDLQLRGFNAVETGVYAAELDGDIVVQNGPTRNGVTYPRATGQVIARRAVVLYDFTGQSEAEQVAATTRPLYWVYGIQLEARSGLRWRPADADIEFSADLSVEQTLDSLLIFGEVRALRGSYFFLNNQFRVGHALLSFDNVGGVDPLLDISATTRVPRAALFPASGGALTAAEQTGSEEVTATIQGRASNATMHFTSTAAEADEPAILRALTYAQFQSGELRGQLVENYLTRMLSRELSSQLAGAFGRYVGEWELGREASGQFTLGVGTQLSRELSLRYRQALPGYTPSPGPAAGKELFERDVEAEYRLSRFIYLTTGIAQRRASLGTQAAGTTTDFNLNLKVRYEY